MKELSKKSSLVDALEAMPVGSHCVFGKRAVSDARTAWLLSTSHALWHTLDLVQVVKFLQGSLVVHKCVEKPATLWHALGWVGRLRVQEKLLCCSARSVPAGCVALLL